MPPEEPPKARRKKCTTKQEPAEDQTAGPSNAETSQPSLVEKRFQNLIAFLDKPLPEDIRNDFERISALRMVTRYLHENGSSWSDVFKSAAKGEQDGGAIHQTENAALKEALATLKIEYSRIQTELEAAKKEVARREAEEDDDTDIFDAVASTANAYVRTPPRPFGAVQYAESIAVGLFAAAQCLATDTPLMEAAPYAGIIALGYIDGVRRNRRLAGLFFGWLTASIAGGIIFDGLPKPHIVEKAQHVIATTYPLPKTGFVTEQIPFEISKKLFAGQFVVTTAQTTEIKGTGYQTCVTFDLVPFDKGLIDGKVKVIEGSSNKVCFPSTPSGQGTRLMLDAPKS